MVFNNFKTQVFDLLQGGEGEGFCASDSGEVLRGGAVGINNAVSVNIPADYFDFHDFSYTGFLYSFPAGNSDRDCGLFGRGGMCGD